MSKKTGERIYVTHVIAYLCVTSTLTNRGIAKRCSCSTSVVDRAVRGMSQEIRQARNARRKTMREEEIARYQELRDLGATLSEISETCGRGVKWLSDHTHQGACSPLRAFSAPEKASIVEAYLQPGASLRTVGEQFATSHDTVHQIVKVAGVSKNPSEWRRSTPVRARAPRPRRRKRLTGRDLGAAAAVALRSAGFRFAEIAEALDRPLGTVDGWVRKHGGSAKDVAHHEIPEKPDGGSSTA